MNKIKQPNVVVDEQPKKAAAKGPARPGAGESFARRFIGALNVFSYFDKQSIMKVLPFFFFITGLAVINIANNYVAERTIRDIDKTERELKELRSEFITGKSELMYRSKLSEVATAIHPMGLSESTVAPKKIVVHTKTH